MKNNDFLWGVRGRVQAAARSQAAPVFHRHVDSSASPAREFCGAASSDPRDARSFYLGEVSDVEQVEGLEQVALPQVELAVASGQKGADIFQAQELKTDGETPVKKNPKPCRPQSRVVSAMFETLEHETKECCTCARSSVSTPEQQQRRRRRSLSATVSLQ